jgi:Protein of unknown function (DUF3078)
MKNIFKTLIVLLIIFANFSFGKEDSTQVNKWIPTAVAGLNVSQLALSNWTQGGVNALTWTLSGNLGLKYVSEDWGFRNGLKIDYGRSKLGGNDFQTNDNDFYLESVLTKNIGWKVDPYFSNIIRTTIAPGYSYATPTPQEIANFFDPGYVTQSVGMAYQQLTGFSTMLGLAVQEVFANKFTQYTDDPTTTKIEKFKFETGLQSVTSGKFVLDDNLLLTSSLTLFTRFKSLDVWDVRWDNVIVAKVNSWLNVNFSYLLIYQKDQSATTQMKEGLQLGIVYTLL